jgi:heptosyltransferase-2
MKAQSQDFRRILIVHTAFVGDVILMTPLIRAAKQVFPGAQIDALVIPETAGLLKNNPHIRTIQIFDKRKNKFKSFFETVFQLRKEKYDAAFLPHSSFTTIALVTFSGIKWRIGFDRNISRYWLTKRVPFRNGIHRIDKNLDLIRLFSNSPFDLQTELVSGTIVRERVGQLLRDLNNGRKLIAVAPGSVWNTKRWPEEHYVQLVRLLSERGFGILLIGSKEERPLCERIQPRENFINLAGETSFLESAAVLEKCELLVCNDSGAMHIANAVKTDVVAFFGPTVRAIGYFPYREEDIVLETNLECRPCSSHGSDRCPLGHHNCMKYLSVKSAFDVIIKKLSN